MIFSEVSEEGFQIPATITERYKVGRTIGDGNFAVVKECVERWGGDHLHPILKETFSIVFSKIVPLFAVYAHMDLVNASTSDVKKILKKEKPI